jgi:hypothetical protein
MDSYIIPNTCKDAYCVIAVDFPKYVQVICSPIVAWKYKGVDGSNLEPVHVFSSTNYGINGRYLCTMYGVLTDSLDGRLLEHLKRISKPIIYLDPSGIYHRYLCSEYRFIPHSFQSSDILYELEF